MERRKSRRRLLLRTGAFSLLVLFLLFVFMLKMRPVILRCAQTAAERILLNSADEAVVRVLKDCGVTYDSIVRLSRDESGRIHGLQADAVQINLIKSRIALEITRLVARKETYAMSIPVGTFVGSAYTAGLGPKVKFAMQLSSSARVNLRYELETAGLNQVEHRILLDIEMSGRLVMKGASETFHTSTGALLAETVIVGMTPEAFTEVIETGGSDMSAMINDYGARAAGSGVKS